MGKIHSVCHFSLKKGKTGIRQKLKSGFIFFGSWPLNNAGRVARPQGGGALCLEINDA